MSASFPAILAAVAARGPRCGRCGRWTMEPDQNSYTHPMCDDCATYLEDLAIRFVGPVHRPVGPAHQPKSRRPGRVRSRSATTAAGTAGSVSRSTTAPAAGTSTTS